MQTLKEDVRLKIIKAGKQVFCEEGFHNASMRNIAKKAKISAGNIYRYYSTKEKLLEEILKELTDEIKDFFEKIPSLYQTLERKELLKLVIDTILKWQEENGGALNVLLSCRNHKQFIDFRERTVNLFAENIEQIVKKEQSGDHQVCMAIAYSLFEGVVYLVVNNSFSTQEMKNRLESYLAIMIKSL